MERLLKLEVPELATRVMEIVEKHDSETLKIKESFNLLAEKQPLINLLEVRYGPHPITEELIPLRRKRILYATAISFQMRALINADVDGTDENVKVAKVAVIRYLANLRSNNEKLINQKVTQFFGAIDDNEELSVALTELNFTPYLDELLSVHTAVRERLATRTTLLSNRKVEVLSIRQSIFASLRQLFKQINLAKLQYPEVDYTPLVDELNVLLTSFGNLINTRTSLNKKKANNAINSTESGDSMQTSSFGIFSDNGDNVETLDNKKTVAVSGTTSTTVN